ncbi:unnamed protein product [Malus baccata var. baccata]
MSLELSVQWDQPTWDSPLLPPIPCPLLPTLRPNLFHLTLPMDDCHLTTQLSLSSSSASTESVQPLEPPPLVISGEPNLQAATKSRHAHSPLSCPPPGFSSSAFVSTRILGKSWCRRLPSMFIHIFHITTLYGFVTFQVSASTARFRVVVDIPGRGFYRSSEVNLNPPKRAIYCNLEFRLKNHVINSLHGFPGFKPFSTQIDVPRRKLLPTCSSYLAPQSLGDHCVAILVEERTLVLHPKKLTFTNNISSPKKRVDIA